MGLAVLDLDGTLVPGPTTQRRLFRRLVRRGVLAPLPALGKLGVTGARLIQGGMRTAQASGAYLAGLGVATVQREARDLVEVDLLPLVRPQLLQCIADHRRRGDYVALVSGAPSLVVRPLAEHLELDAAIGSEPRQENGFFVDEPVRLHVVGREKQRVVASLCKWLEIPPLDCTAYADSSEDRWLLAWVGRPIAVAPDAGLRRLARTRHWECIEQP